jgi:hypothetical protein
MPEKLLNNWGKTIVLETDDIKTIALGIGKNNK